MQGPAAYEFLCDVPFECCAVGSVSRHGFHPPEAQQGVPVQIAQSVHPQGRIGLCRPL